MHITHIAAAGKIPKLVAVELYRPRLAADAV